MLSLCLLLGVTEAFLMTRVDPGQILVSPGQTVELLCQVDDHYEYCKWINPQQQFCDFEWKRAAGNITMQTCQFPDRVTFHAKYDDKECGITITAREEDQGVWKCEMEDYVFGGSRGSGDIEVGQMTVKVHTPTPPTTRSTSPRGGFNKPTSPMRTITDKPLPPIKSTTITTTTTTRRYRTTTTATTTTTTTTTTTMTGNGRTTTTIHLSNTSALPHPVPKSSLEEPKAKPSTQDTGGSSAGVVGGLLLGLIIIVTVVFGIVYYRKRKARIPVVGYATASATADTAGMMAGSQGITIHSPSSTENTNFHEYFPPNLTYSTSQSQA